MKSIVLQRRVVVECWHVLGEVARASKRPEMMPVLMRARERTQTSADDIAEHLLFEQHSRRVVAERLLGIAERYGLLAQTDRKFTLTAAGNLALDTQQIFVPERGAWTIWASADPLLDYPILRIDPWEEPTAHDEAKRGKGREQSTRQFVNVPQLLASTRQRVGAPAGGDGAQRRIDELAAKAEWVKADASLDLVWNVSEKKLRLRGTLSGNPIDVPLVPPAVEVADVWQQLLELVGFGPRWDGKRNALLVGFDETAGPERESLLRDLPIATPTLRKYGTFGAMTVRDVPLQAISKPDAARWAEWRLRERVRDYATTERFDAWTNEAKAPFASYGIATPTRAELARDAWQRRGERPSPFAWHLTAAEDWSL